MTPDPAPAETLTLLPESTPVLQFVYTSEKKPKFSACAKIFLRSFFPFFRVSVKSFIHLFFIFLTRRATVQNM